MCSKAAFSGLIHARGASMVCSKQTETWDKWAGELHYHFSSGVISSTNINYSRQTSVIWIKRPRNREGPWVNSIRESLLCTMALLLAGHQAWVPVWEKEGPVVFCCPPAMPAGQRRPKCLWALGATGKQKAFPTESAGFLTVFKIRVRNGGWAGPSREAGQP